MILSFLASVLAHASSRVLVLLDWMLRTLFHDKSSKIQSKQQKNERSSSIPSKGVTDFAGSNSNLVSTAVSMNEKRPEGRRLQRAESVFRRFDELVYGSSQLKVPLLEERREHGHQLVDRPAAQRLVMQELPFHENNDNECAIAFGLRALLMDPCLHYGDNNGFLIQDARCANMYWKLALEKGLESMAANGSSARAQYLMACIHETSSFSYKNWSLSTSSSSSSSLENMVHWYKLAAEHGHADAQFTLGCLYDEGILESDRDHTQRTEEWNHEKKGDDDNNNNNNSDDDHSQNSRYSASLTSSSTTSSTSTENSSTADASSHSVAVKWYMMAAQQGHAEAQCNLGLWYANQADQKKAIEWFEKASRQGLADAQYNLGKIYEQELMDLKKTTTTETEALPSCSSSSSSSSSSSGVAFPLLLAFSFSFSETTEGNNLDKNGDEKQQPQETKQKEIHAAAMEAYRSAARKGLAAAEERLLALEKLLR